MKSKTKILLASMFFLVIVILHLTGLLFDGVLAFFTKPFITISLAIVYLTSVKRANFWYVSALFFSFWGDTFLLFKEEFFLFGLLSFLIAHVLYIKITASYLRKVNLTKIAISAIPFIITFGSIVYIINDNLHAMLVPVIIYGVIISTFATLTLVNYKQEKNTRNLWFFLGSVIFVLSDSLLAINKFYDAREVYGISIMITYIVAQYLICKATIVKDCKQ